MDKVKIFFQRQIFHEATETERSEASMGFRRTGRVLIFFFGLETDKFEKDNRHLGLLNPPGD